MKLDEYELDYVKYFVQVKGYRQYEVLAEIMDHFVLLLEEKKEEMPAGSFEVLVDEVYEMFGKTAFEEIHQSTKGRIRKKFNGLFFSHLMVFLHYQYVLVIALVGVLLYNIQSFMQNEVDYLVVHSASTFIMYFFTFKFSSATDVGNPNFLCNRIAKKYGFCLFVISSVIFGIAIKIVLRPASMGFNLFYLMSTVLLILQAIVLYSLVRTARIVVEESEVMEETYQVLK